MTADLLRAYPLIGRSKTDVVNLLGPGEKTPHKFADFELVYVLGPDRSMMPIDYEWLLISVGKDGRNDSVRVVDD